jgi:hypothetical protein
VDVLSASLPEDRRPLLARLMAEALEEGLREAGADGAG